MRITITPEQADHILSTTNNSNRNINGKAVAFISNQLINGLWAYNGQSIVVGSDGELLDGQHRLAACVRSGVSLDTEIVYNVPKESFSTMDSGRPRGAADCFALKNIPNSTLSSSVMRNCVLYSKLKGLSFAFSDTALSSVKIPSSTLLSTYENITNRFFGVNDVHFDDVSGFISYFGNSVGKRTGLKQGAYVFAALVTYLIDKERAIEFIDLISDGLFTSKDDPCKKLLEFTSSGSNLPASFSKSHSTVTLYRVSMYFRAWNSFCNGSELKALRVTKNHVSPVSNNIHRDLGVSPLSLISDK